MISSIYKILPLAVFLLVGCHTRAKHHDMPPGFEIECDEGNGIYRAVYSDTHTELFTVSPLNSRQEAIDSAWAQYDWKKEKDSTRWKKCP